MLPFKNTAIQHFVFLNGLNTIDTFYELNIFASEHIDMRWSLILYWLLRWKSLIDHLVQRWLKASAHENAFGGVGQAIWPLCRKRISEAFNY
ncbi:hypothetical protein M5689_016616 [Euphorbia peplus]|nr:hypothetical protein M5689_016616 [Euphorbia peplus]